MGGKGSGGARPGTGRKPKLNIVPPPSTNSDSAGSERFEEFHAPDALSAKERKVWCALAPLAVKRKTLTTSTALAFELLCRNIVLERSLAADADERGKSDHRNMIQRVDAELLAFDLRPNGKPHGEATAEQPKQRSPLEQLKARRQALHAVR